MDKLLEKLNQKKMIENLVIFLILAIIVMIVLNSIYDGAKNTSQKTVNSTLNEVTQLSTNLTFEDKLSRILSQISGAGKVDVMIAYKNEIQKIPMTDVKTTTTITNEKDSNGGERKTEQISKEESVIYDEAGSNKTPVISQSVLPEIVGVIVVADGAGNLSVEEKLIKAVEAIIDVPSHHVQVFAR